MGRTWRLNRTNQCKNCPWKVSTNTDDIPNYQMDLHKDLKGTIASGDNYGLPRLKIMSCHESKDSEPEHCIGWMRNQLGRGNNLALRIDVMSCENVGQIKTFGNQHQLFAETFGYEDPDDEDDDYIDEEDDEYIDDEGCEEHDEDD